MSQEADRETIESLAAGAGVATEYTDWRGRQHAIPRETVALALRALRAEEEAGAPTVLPAVVSRFGDEASEIPIENAPAGSALSLELEAGGVRQLATDLVGSLRFELPAELPEGYHRLVLSNGSERHESTLIIAPERCYEPPALADGERLWGVSVQLYGLRSDQDWGIGDFGALTGFLRGTARLGADAVGLNPLHALYRDDPERCSPYAPSHREFLNPLYIDVTAVPEFADCESVRRRSESDSFRAGLAGLREAVHVDYAAVARLKFGVLRELFGHFSRHHLVADTARARDFRTWCRDRGERLFRFATFEALRGHFAAEGSPTDWRRWPESFRDPASAAVQRFRDEHPGAVAFALYLQWIADGQLAAAQAAASEAGMKIGLYLDLALGTPPDAAEAWMAPELAVQGMSVGAPPDALALKGQDWGLAPLSPRALEAQGMAPWRRLVAAAMRHAGAVRIDHVMSLMRLWWVPAGHEAGEGVYVANPLRHMLAVLTLESRRRRCLVIGEDLGTVAPAVRTAMEERGIYSYGVLYFEKDEEDQFRRPADFPRRRLVSVATHDLPTLASYWEDTDIALRSLLGLFPHERAADELAAARAWDRGAMLYALEREGLLPPDMRTDPATVPVMTRRLALAIETYLARSSAGLLMVQPEDWTLTDEAVNVPGTSDEYPNWRRRLTRSWPDLLACPEVIESCRRIDEARAGGRAAEE
ncbi:MAG: 4-alpha-glucanotransferase [Gammaproteobacteria bacterium]